jgi:hypothetical protein
MTSANCAAKLEKVDALHSILCALFILVKALFFKIKLNHQSKLKHIMM